MDEDDIVEMSDNFIYNLESTVSSHRMTEEDQKALFDELIDVLTQKKEDLE
jgi:hypothetical protein